MFAKFTARKTMWIALALACALALVAPASVTAHACQECAGGGQGSNCVWSPDSTDYCTVYQCNVGGEWTYCCDFFDCRV